MNFGGEYQNMSHRFCANPRVIWRQAGMHTAPKSLPGVSPVITAAPVKLDYCNLLRQIAANRNKRDNRREREREKAKCFNRRSIEIT